MLKQDATSFQLRAARAALALAVAFLFLLLLLHFLEPELDPAHHLISEYEDGRFGWMMTLAFFCWGGSVIALAAALWNSLSTIAGLIGRFWLALIGVALLGAGAFITNASTNTVPNMANTVHGLLAAFVIFTFPIAASLAAESLARRQEWHSARRVLFWTTLLTWLGLLAFFGSNVVVSVAQHSGGGAGADFPLGWPNRFMVLVYLAWLIIAARGVTSQDVRRIGTQGNRLVEPH